MRMTILLLLLASPAAYAADFPDWMRGSWRSVIDGVTMEEHWTDARGGVMLGAHRDVRPNGKTSFEFMRIEKKDGVLTYLAMPGGRPATPFPFQSAEAKRIVFENAKHDFPQRIIYWRSGEKLCARVEGTMNGKLEGEEWCWARVKQW